MVTGPPYLYIYIYKYKLHKPQCVFYPSQLVVVVVLSINCQRLGSRDTITFQDPHAILFFGDADLPWRCRNPNGAPCFRWKFGLVLGGWPSKIEVIGVPGRYIYIYIHIAFLWISLRILWKNMKNICPHITIWCASILDPYSGDSSAGFKKFQGISPSDEALVQFERIATLHYLADANTWGDPWGVAGGGYLWNNSGVSRK